MRGPGQSYWTILLFGLIGYPHSLQAVDLRAVVGLEYDDNPFESSSKKESGLVNRFFVATSGHLLKCPGGGLHLGYQGGVKRIWREDPQIRGSFGDVITNDLKISGHGRILRRLILSGAGNLKIKNVNQLSSEEGYLRGSMDASIAFHFGRGISGGTHYRWGGDDSRDADLPSVWLNESGLKISYRRSRRFQGHVNMVWRWMDYDRPALEMTPGGLRPRNLDQSDRLTEISAGLRIYHGMLVHAGYAFLNNRSNSFGYRFRAHRIRLVLTRHIAYEVDGQAYLTIQLRRYTEPLTPLPGAGSEVDEYEQNLLVLKLSRKLTSRVGMSVQYGSFRNGARRGGGFYRKNVYTISLEASI